MEDQQEPVCCFREIRTERPNGAIEVATEHYDGEGQVIKRDVRIEVKGAEIELELHVGD